MQLVIEPGVVVRCIYSEDIDLAALGSPAIRASTSSRTSRDAGGPTCRQWVAIALDPTAVAARPSSPKWRGWK